MKTSQKESYKRIVALGDSLTWGYPGAFKVAGGQGILRRSEHNWPSQLAREVGVEVVNVGVNGDTFGSMMQRLRRDVFAHGADTVIVTGGSNDVAHGLHSGQIQRRALGLSEELERHRLKVVWGIPPTYVSELVGRYWNDAPVHKIEETREELSAFSNWLRRWAARTIDFDAALRLSGIPLDELLPDGIHPTDQAYDLMAAAAIEALTT